MSKEMKAARALNSLHAALDAWRFDHDRLSRAIVLMALANYRMFRLKGV
jgi:hypothetical protein